MSASFRVALPKTISAFLPLILSGLLQAQIREPISDFKLLTPSTGWVVAGNNLLWTDSAGSSWSSITPSASKGGPIHGVFFINATSGWTLLTKSGTNDTAGQLQLMRSEERRVGQEC